MFYEVQVEVLAESDTGRLKKIKEYYLVQAVSVILMLKLRCIKNLKTNKMIGTLKW